MPGYSRYKQFISSGHLLKATKNEVIDNFRLNAGMYYTLYNPEPYMYFKNSGLNYSIKGPVDKSFLYSGVGGCFGVNDIYKIYEIKVTSPLGAAAKKENPTDLNGRTLEQFTELLYGLGPEGIKDPFAVTPVTGNIPFGQMGLFNKTFFTTRFYDYSYKKDAPINKKLLGSYIDTSDPKSNITKLTSYQYNMKYNYYVEEYENALDQGTEEANLPYLYNFVDEIHNNNLITINNKLMPLDMVGLKRFYWDDPKVNIFMGGSSTNVTPNAHLNQPEYIYNLPESNLYLNFVSTFKSPAYYIALVENAINNSGFNGLPLDFPNAEFYPFEGKPLTFAEYFRKWGRETENPSSPTSAKLSLINDDASLVTTNNARNTLRGKYRNIMFKQMNLMTYSRVIDELFPMCVKFSLNNNVDAAHDLGTVAVKNMLIKHFMYEPLFVKFLDTTARSYPWDPDVAVSSKADYGLEEDHFHDPESYFPLTLAHPPRLLNPGGMIGPKYDPMGAFWKQRTGFFEVDATLSDKAEVNSVHVKQQWNAKMIDYADFSNILKNASGPYESADTSPLTVYSHNTRWVKIGEENFSLLDSPNADWNVGAQGPNVGFGGKQYDLIGDNPVDPAFNWKGDNIWNGSVIDYPHWGKGPASDDPDVIASDEPMNKDKLGWASFGGDVGMMSDMTKANGTVPGLGADEYDFGLPPGEDGFLGGAGKDNLNSPQGGLIDHPAFDPIEGTLPDAAWYGSEEFYKFVQERFDDMTALGPPFKNAKTYNEILYFRVAKHEINEETGQPIPDPIQSTYFPNNTRAFDYIDTQVKYGKRYHYEVHAITLLIGIKYFYRWPTPAQVSAKEDLEGSQETTVPTPPQDQNGGFQGTGYKGGFGQSGITIDPGAPDYTVGDPVGFEKGGPAVGTPGPLPPMVPLSGDFEGFGEGNLPDWSNDAIDAIYAGPGNIIITGFGDFFTSPVEFSSTFQLVMEPNVVISEMPYATFGEISVLSHPPVPPIVEWIVYKNEKDKIGISLRNASVTSKMVPMPVEPSDVDFYQQIMQAQQLSGDDEGKILFKSDDELTNYRIYRLDKKPLHLGEFANSYELHNVFKQGTNILVNETMEPNRKYYFMFRAEDVHGGISNPSHIYEIELVTLVDGLSENTPVAVYPIIKGFTVEEFFKGEAFPKTKSFKRYIYIKPSPNQEQISNLDGVGTLKSYYAPEFGTQVPDQRYVIGKKKTGGETTLKRKIKIRLTSKATGRKIDLNLNFNHIHVPFEEFDPNKNDKTNEDLQKAGIALLGL